MTGRLLCAGHGYTARRLAAALGGRGWSVVGTTRDGRDGTRRFSREHPLQTADFDGITHILTSIPPDGTGDILLDMHRRELHALPELRWIGYLGTTAVYGDRGGEWVDEDSATMPTLDRARRRERAERAWLDSGLPVHIFRLAGIYGPGRNAFVNLRNGTARRIVKPGQLFSRIHVDDIVAVLLASIASPDPGRIYNVCDEEPAPPQDVVAHAAGLMGVEPPPEQAYETADLPAMARTFYADSRKVRAARIRDELGVQLRYPTYREGLAALLEEWGSGGTGGPASGSTAR